MGIPRSPPWFISMLLSQLSLHRPDMMDPTRRLPDTQPDQMADTYDFVIVGAGTGGCIMANRLSEISDWKILVLEAGEDADVTTEIPMLTRDSWMTRHDWNYTTEKQQRACLAFDGVCYMPRGRSIGGTSILNYMMYIRGNKLDYDTWQSMDVVGWSYDKVLPYFLKSEDFVIGGTESKHHSTGGPVGVDYPKYATPLRDAYIKAGEELGYKTGDYNAEVQTGIHHPQFTMKDSLRVNTGKAYLRPIKDRKNVHVIKNAFVTKINFDNTNSVETVEYEMNGENYKVKVTKEVILTAGVYNTPKILMLSGIGPKDHLESLNIPVLVDSKVGDDLQDAISVPMNFKVKDDVVINRARFENKETIDEFARDMAGPLTSVVGFEGLGFFNFNDKVNETLPDFMTAMISYMPYGNESLILMSSNVLRPKSRGTVRLRSSDPKDPPIIDPKYLSDKTDYEGTIQACVQIMKLAKTNSLKSFNLEYDSTFMQKCSSFKSDKDICKCLTENYSHPLFTAGGTAKMAHPKEAKKSVVCPLLRVHGVHGLRVADTSVMPLLTSGDNYAPSIMIAEYGADMIKRQWM